MMHSYVTVLGFVLAGSLSAAAQSTTLSPETLWSLGRVSPLGITTDKQFVIYQVSTPDMAANASNKKYYKIPVSGGTPLEISDFKSLIPNKDLSPDGSKEIQVERVKVRKVNAIDYYPEMSKAQVQIYDGLHYRHWDSWQDGSFNHLVLYGAKGSRSASRIKDIMENEPYHTPTVPFGGDEDYTWSPDGKSIVYVCKKSEGTAYVTSTNTDLFEYNLESGLTTNLTPGRKGYDTHPLFHSSGTLAWLSMARDGYEADKNDIIVKGKAGEMNLTAGWDGTVSSFAWAEDGKKLFFVAPVKGTEQLFEVDYPGLTKKMPVVKQITKGDFNVQQIVGQTGNTLIVSRCDFNTASELYTVNLTDGSMKALTHVNDAAYAGIKKCKAEGRFSKTHDGKDLFSWVIYPPDFDPAKKYPTLLYCQGGPQSALSQFYSFRWNFQLMASMGYIVVAPNRRGMPGWGVEWNEAISKDWGGGAMQDYLTAIDDISKESYVDKERLGCVGASYGGYSVFYLAGIHQKRFKSFISHCGVFDLRSMYGTTEEMFFVNFDMGGAYWAKDNAAAQKTMEKFDPSSLVSNWDTPIMIIQGGKDYRVPIGQGQEAFNAAQLQGIKSRFVYFPEENHWVSQPQNGLTWQREFFRWLKETL